MATKTFGSIADRAVNSLKELQKGRWWDDMQELQDYPMMRVFQTMSKERSGNKLSWRIGVGSDAEDGHHGLYEDYDLDRPDVMIEGSQDWRNERQGFALDERELDENQAPEHLVDDMETLFNDMFSNLAEDMENGAFQVPSTNDVLLPHGIPYNVTWADVTGGGFTSQLPLGHTDVNGIVPSVNTKYRNWSELYTAMIPDDGLLKISRAIRHTRFRPPAKVKGEDKVTHAIYMDADTIEQHEQAAEKQNDQLGDDVQSMFQRSMIARIKPTWVPVLDTAAASGSNPVYIINHTQLFPIFKKGWKFKQYGPIRASKQHPAIEMTVWATYNWAARTRRRLAVIAKSAPFGEA
jgi:hypothetical protein